MKKTDVLVIGGSAAGIVTATTGKAFYPDRDFLLVRKEKEVLIPCGIPYLFASLKSSEQDLIPDKVLQDAGVELKIDEVVSLDQENKLCKTAEGSEIYFEKLVLAIGSVPVLPDLKGKDLKNVFTIAQDKEYLDKMIARLKECQKVVVIGGGFIGVEVSDEINRLGKEITIIEQSPHILGGAFDNELALKAQEILESEGLKIRTGEKVKEILGDKKVTGVSLNSGEKLDADAVILSIGYQPATGLAEKAGIEINDRGFIKVDEYMRTKNFDILAVGDCAEKKNFITRRPTPIMLASSACAEARIAGINLYTISAVRSFSGTIAIFSTVVGKTAFAAAGITEQEAKKKGFDILTGRFEGIDKHPQTLPDTNKQIVKLIATRESGVLLGGEIIGGPSTGELINLIGFAIENRMTVNSVLTAQIGTHPLLTGPPTAYPVIRAAQIIALKRRGRG